MTESSCAIRSRLRTANFSSRGLSFPSLFTFFVRPISLFHHVAETSIGLTHGISAVGLMLGVLSGPAETSAQDLAKAIDTAASRVVKLYGLGVGSQVGYGSATMVGPDGLLLTVNSLLIDARTVRVIMPDGARYEADIIYRDPEKHLALLRMKFRDEQRITRENLGQSTTPGPFAYFDLYTGTARAASEPLTECSLAPPAIAAGDWVVAAGNAFKVADGAEPVSVTHGIFSTRTKLDARRRVRDFPYRGDVLVIDAVTSNPGAAGGVVVNLDGRLVGLIGRDVISNLTHTHFNYALPLEVLQSFFQEAVTNPECRIATSEGPSEHRAPGALFGRRSSDDEIAGSGGSAGATLDYGIKMNRAGYRTVLPFVERVRPDSPAARAGLRADDLILSVNGKSVADLAEFDEQLRLAGPGTALDLVIRRERRILSIRVEPK